MCFQFLKNLIDDFSFIFFVVEGGVNNEDICGSRINTHKLSKGVLPHISHIFKGIIMDFWILYGITKFNVVFFCLEDGLKFFTEIYFFWWWGIVLGDDVGVSWNSVDDDRGVILTWATNFDGLGAVIDDDHLFEVDLGLEIFASLEDIAGHLFTLLHDCNLF